MRVQSVGTGPVGGETGSGACCVLLRSLGFVLWLVRRTEGCKQRLESVPTEEPPSRAATPTAHAQPRPAPRWARGAASRTALAARARLAPLTWAAPLRGPLIQGSGKTGGVATSSDGMLMVPQQKAGPGAAQATGLRGKEGVQDLVRALARGSSSVVFGEGPLGGRVAAQFPAGLLVGRGHSLVLGGSQRQRPPRGWRGSQQGSKLCARYMQRGWSQRAQDGEAGPGALFRFPFHQSTSACGLVLGPLPLRFPGSVSELPLPVRLGKVPAAGAWASPSALLGRLPKPGRQGPCFHRGPAACAFPFPSVEWVHSLSPPT